MTSTAASSQPHTGSVRPSKSLHPCLNVLTCKIEIVLSGYSFIHFLIVNQSRALNNPFTTKHYALSKKPSGSQQQVFLPTSAPPTNPASSCWPHTSGFYTFSESFPLSSHCPPCFCSGTVPGSSPVSLSRVPISWLHLRVTLSLSHTHPRGHATSSYRRSSLPGSLTLCRRWALLVAWFLEPVRD